MWTFIATHCPNKRNKNTNNPPFVVSYLERNSLPSLDVLQSITLLVCKSNNISTDFYNSFTTASKVLLR